jgi:hypothetical protein
MVPRYTRRRRATLRCAPHLGHPPRDRGDANIPSLSRAVRSRHHPRNVPRRVRVRITIERSPMPPTGTLALAHPHHACHPVPTMVRCCWHSNHALPTSTLAPRMLIRMYAGPPRTPLHRRTRRAPRARPSRHLPRRPLPHHGHCSRAYYITNLWKIL